MGDCVFSLCHLFDGLLLGLITGVISGLYTAFVAERIQRFYQIRNDALRRVRSIDFMSDDENFKIQRTNPQLGEAQREFVLLSSELYGLGHTKAGDAINKMINEFIPIISAHSIPPNFDETYSRWQKELRELPPSRWIYYRPW